MSGFLRSGHICQKQGAMGFFMVCCAAFAENALFKNSAVICRSPLLSLLPDELAMHKGDSDGFFSKETNV